MGLVGGVKGDGQTGVDPFRRHSFDGCTSLCSYESSGCVSLLSLVVLAVAHQRVERVART